MLAARSRCFVGLAAMTLLACDGGDEYGGLGSRYPRTRGVAAQAGSPEEVSTGAGSGEVTASSASGEYASDLELCVAVTNRYRTSAGRPALARSAALEAFAAKAAAADAASGSAHGYFRSTRGGGVAKAENVIPGWPLRQGVAAIIDRGLQAMWNEGPGGGHHDNMASTRYREVGCGVAITADDEVWIVQDFR